MSESPYSYYNNQIGVKIKYLISDQNKHADSLSLISYRALKKRMDSNTSSERQLRKGSWSSDALICYNSIPRGWKDALTKAFGEPKQEAKKDWFASHYMFDTQAEDFYTRYRYGEHGEKKLTNELIDIYSSNASLLNTIIQVKHNRKDLAKIVGNPDFDTWESLSRDVNAFNEVSHNLPTNKNSLRRKVKQYQEGGYEALISKKLENANAASVRSKEQEALLTSLCSKHTNLDNETIAALYNTIAEKTGGKTITAATVRNHRKKNHLITFAARNGSKALRNKLLMQVKRSAPSKPMLYWTIDGWDVELLYQKTTTNKKGHRQTTYHNRLTLVVVLDPFNKYPIGYAIGTHETPELIKRAIQNAINHTKELFGTYYKPFQLQSDNYAIKKLKPLYEACTPNFTPATVGNAKAKIVEPYFRYLIDKYCKLLDNFSGYNVDSGSKNQPNSEMLNKIRHHFPDEFGCRKQIENIIATERAKKQVAFTAKWQEVEACHRQEMDLQTYLQTFGSTTHFTNRLTGEGIVITIDGVKRYYDCFDVHFRMHALENWNVLFDPNNLEHALAVSEDGKLSFMLEEKYIQPMALADQKKGDATKRKRIHDYNKDVEHFITDTLGNYTDTVEYLFTDNPELNDTLAKHVLVDSLGQYKNHRNEGRELAAKGKALEAKQARKEAKKQKRNAEQEQLEYYRQKTDISKYMNA